MQIQSIQTKKIYKTIVEQIINLIREGSLKCGDKLPAERSLAEALNVSRASLREAMSVMEIIGIIEIRPGEGSFVSNFNVQPFLSTVIPLLLKGDDILDDLLDFRKLLESGGIHISVKNASKNPVIIEEIKSILNNMEIAIDDPDEGAKLDIQFHKKLLSLTNNKVLINVLDYIEFILDRAVRFNRSMLLQNKENAKMIIKQHRGIYEAIIDGDAESVETRLEEHLDFVKEAME